MSNPTWAQRARSTDPSVPPTTIPRTTTTTPSNSKASTSHNWRAGSGKVVSEENAGGWKTEERKERKSRSSAIKSGNTTHQESRPSSAASNRSTAIATSSSTSWAAAGPDDTLPSPTFAPVPLPSLAVTLSLASSSIPSDSSPALSELGSSVATSVSANSPKLPPLSAPREKVPAPLPKLNPWTVRKEQLAAASASVPSPIGGSSSTGATISAGVSRPQREKKSHEDKKGKSSTPPVSANGTSTTSIDSTRGQATNKNIVRAPGSASNPVLVSVASTPTSTSASKDDSTSPSPRAASTEKLVADESTAPVNLSVSANTLAVLPRKAEGWKGLKEVQVGGGAFVGDRESWPSPNEEVSSKQKKDKIIIKEEKAGEELSFTKKKAKWITIPVEITVNGGPSGRLSTAGEKRPKTGRRDGVSDSHRSTGQEDGGKAKSAPGSKAPAGRGNLSGSGSTSRAAATASSEKKVSSPKPTIPSAPTSTRPTTAPTNSSLPPKPASSIKPIKAQMVGPSSKSSNTVSAALVQTLTPENILRPFSNPSVPAPASSVTTPLSNTTNLSTATTSKLESAAHSGQSSNPATGYRGTGMRGMRGASRGRGGAIRNPFATRPPTTISPFPEYVPSLTNGAGAAVFYPGFQGSNYPTFQPVQPVLDPYTLDPTRYWLLGQIEYYFSIDNLCRDMFLRSKMDSQGWIDISVIASFNRIKNLSGDVNIVRETASLTPILEVVGSALRLRTNWPEWVLPSAVPSTFSHPAAVTTNDSLPESTSASSTTSVLDSKSASYDHSSDGGASTLATTTVSTGGSQLDEEDLPEKDLPEKLIASALST